MGICSVCSISNREFGNLKIGRYILGGALCSVSLVPITAQDTLSTNDFHIDEVQVVQRRKAVTKSRTSAFDTEKLSADQLCTAACCNLSESFENSASVDVAYADAATGAKQIRLLGLSGTYVQMLSENTPGVRGLAQTFGMEYIPGPWMNSIQVSKGTSSVINGYEAMTGQINVEFLKPQTADHLTINAMLSRETHAELNLIGAWDVDERCSSALFAHGQVMGLEFDHNKDGFVDMPKNYQANVMNRWYIKDGDYTGQVLVRGLYDLRQGGQTAAAQQAEREANRVPYNINLRTCRLDGFIKNGYVIDHDRNMSVGIIVAASLHNQGNRYAWNTWNATQTNAYLNAIFQTNFEDEVRDPEDDHEHKLSAGLSFNYDRLTEESTIYGVNPITQMPDLYITNEFTPGIFAEYTYMFQDKVTLLAGLRLDGSNRYGIFVTPRMNIRYAPFEWWTLRGSVGLGYRTPYYLADNAGYIVSNRNWQKWDWIENTSIRWQDDSHMERAVNAGATMTFYIPIGKRELQLSAEYYYTRFLDGVIADIDRDRHAVYLYNIRDNVHHRSLQSFAHNWQIEASMEILRGWTMTAAFRYTDTRQSTFNTEANEFQVREKPLQNRFKGIITTSYQTPLKKWQFDFTAQFNGPGRMPDGFILPTDDRQYYVSDGVIYHKWYPQLLAQITKYFRTCSIYVGAENMTNYTQNRPIVSAEDILSPDFDASQVWAPTHGWKLYIGFRWALERPDED